MRLFNIRSIFLIILLVLSVALYFFTEARYAALLIILLLLIIISAFVIAFLTGRTLKVSMNAPVRGIQGEPAHVAIKVENKGIFPIFLCRIETILTNMLTDEKDEATHGLSVGRKKTGSVEFSLTEKRCGCISVDLGELRVSDPLGLISVKPKVLEIDKTDGRIYYMPKAAETVMLPEDLTSYDMESYKYSPLKSGSDPSEIFDIREYQQNDNMKAIHWKLTGKMDTPMIKEFGLPVENKLMVIVDKAKRNATADDIERDTDFVSSLSYTMRKRNINHTLGWYNYLKGQFESYRIDDENSFWFAVKELICCPFREDDETGAAHFIESDSNKDFSNYIYITGDKKDTERLMNYGAVSLYDPRDYR